MRFEWRRMLEYKCYIPAAEQLLTDSVQRPSQYWSRQTPPLSSKLGQVADQERSSSLHYCFSPMDSQRVAAGFLADTWWGHPAMPGRIGATVPVAWAVKPPKTSPEYSNLGGGEAGLSIEKCISFTFRWVRSALPHRDKYRMIFYHSLRQKRKERNLKCKTFKKCQKRFKTLEILKRYLTATNW